jgi:hypothetical protein
MTPPDGMLRCLMRYCMRRILFMMPLLVAALATAQTMTEVGASAAGSAIGSAAGKKVSDGITAIFGKVDKTTSKAAAKTPAEDNSKAAPLLDVGPGAPRVSGGGSAGSGGGGSESVPPPPPASGHRASVARPAVTEPLPEILPPPPPPPPPPPQVTADDLKKVANGTSREELLKLGAPVSRIMMEDDGHVLETFTYADKDISLGRVRLTDGVVSSVEIR